MLFLLRCSRDARLPWSDNRRLWQHAGSDLKFDPPRQDYRAFDHVLELAHISRPAVVHQPFHCLSLDAGDLPPDFQAEAADKVVHEGSNILAALAQRRQLNWENVEAVVEILSE